MGRHLAGRLAKEARCAVQVDGRTASVATGRRTNSKKATTRPSAFFYAAAGLDRQVFVSRYLVALPSPEQLRDLIEADRAALESSGTLTPIIQEDKS